MGQSIFVEWVNGSRAERLYKQRRAKAERDFQEMNPETPSPYSDNANDSWWDWVEIDECYENRGFPSVSMAKAWACRNYKLDLFENPRVYKNEWPGDDDYLAETTVELEYQGGGAWMDLSTGNLLDAA